jgi:hypothetical protein
MHVVPVHRLLDGVVSMNPERECHCHDEDESGCADCGNPLGPYNFTGVCKGCQRDRDAEKQWERIDAIAQPRPSGDATTTTGDAT